MFALIRLVFVVALIVVVAGGSLVFASRATCKTGGGEHGKTETRWSVKLPGSKPDHGCKHQETGLSYVLDKVGLK